MKIHWTFLLLVGWVAFATVSQGLGLLDILLALLLLSLVFTCVVLHEYGHALTARRYGVRTKDIILSPIGGIARLLSIPEKPAQEFIIAIAGPLVNVGIALLILFGDWLITGDLLPVLSGKFYNFQDPQTVSSILLKINLLLIGFNMIPAFPMDGGRMARALLSTRFGRLRATRIASLLGRVLAVGFIVYGALNGNFILSVIGIFVFFAASSEYQAVKFERALDGYSLRELLRPVFSRIYQQEPMERPARLLLQGGEADFLVFNEEEQCTGTLGKQEIIKALKSGQLGNPVGMFASEEFEVLDADMRLVEVFRKFQSEGYVILPVVDNGNLIGVVDRQVLANLIDIASASADNGSKTIKVFGRQKDAATSLEATPPGISKRRED